MKNGEKPLFQAQTELSSAEEKKLKAAQDVSQVLAKNDCKSGSANDTTHITVTTSDNQSVTIDMPMVETKRVTVDEKTTVVEDRDFSYGGSDTTTAAKATPAVAPKPSGSISTGAAKATPVKAPQKPSNCFITGAPTKAPMFDDDSESSDADDC